MSTWNLCGGFFCVVDTAQGLTPLQTALAAIQAKTDSLTFTVSGQVDANIQSVNDTEVSGAGTPADPWGP